MPHGGRPFCLRHLVPRQHQAFLAGASFAPCCKSGYQDRVGPGTRAVAARSLEEGDFDERLSGWQLNESRSRYSDPLLSVARILQLWALRTLREAGPRCRKFAAPSPRPGWQAMNGRRAQKSHRERRRGQPGAVAPTWPRAFLRSAYELGQITVVIFG